MSADASSLLKHQIVFLSDGVTQEMANRIIPELLLLDADNRHCSSSTVWAGLAKPSSRDRAWAICMSGGPKVTAPALAPLVD